MKDKETNRVSRNDLFEQVQRARWERYWLREPKEKLDPLLTAFGRSRVKRSLDLLNKWVPFQKPAQVGDLGCGSGAFSKALKESGLEVVAIDVASNALKHLEKSGIVTHRECLPYLKLAEHLFDITLCTDVVAEIEPSLHRLFVSEIARVMKSESWVLLSTPLDLYSENALEAFLALVKTEFEILEIVPSYHCLHYHLLCFWGAPSKFVRGSEDLEFRKKELIERRRLSRLWFALNSTKWTLFFWRPINALTRPIVALLQQNPRLINFLEKTSKMVWKGKACTHIALIGKKRKLKF